MTDVGRAWRIAAVAGLGLLTGAAAAQAQSPVPTEAAGPWGAIAAARQNFGYAFDQPTRAAAELAALVQCEGVAGRTEPCTVRTVFERSCGVLALGNFGEWGAASAATEQQAAQEAVQQCNRHLPTEPCKVAARVCTAGR